MAGRCGYIKTGKEKSKNASKCRSRALYILERSDRTRWELGQKLGQSYCRETVEETLEYLEEHGFVDDRRYAEHYLEMRCRDRGRRAAITELICQKKVPKDIVMAAAGAVPENDECAIIRDWMSRKGIDSGSPDERELVRFYRFMMRRGFESSDILGELEALA